MPRGFRPSEQEGWHHEHVDQGRMQECATPGCREQWQVYCHSGHRKWCDWCKAARKRKRDRVDKKAARFIRKVKASERAEEIRALAVAYADTLAAKGMLRSLAKEIADLAEVVEKAGYVPGPIWQEHERHDRLAKSAGLDREVASYHRNKARERRAQNGAVCVYCDQPGLTRESYAPHFGGKCVGGPANAGRAEAERVIKEAKRSKVNGQHRELSQPFRGR